MRKEWTHSLNFWCLNPAVVRHAHTFKVDSWNKICCCFSSWYLPTLEQNNISLYHHSLLQTTENLYSGIRKYFFFLGGGELFGHVHSLVFTPFQFPQYSQLYLNGHVYRAVSRISGCPLYVISRRESEQLTSSFVLFPFSFLWKYPGFMHIEAGGNTQSLALSDRPASIRQTP